MHKVLTKKDIRLDFKEFLEIKQKYMNAWHSHGEPIVVHVILGSIVEIGLDESIKKGRTNSYYNPGYVDISNLCMKSCYKLEKIMGRV